MTTALAVLMLIGSIGGAADIEHISQGRRVEIERHLVPGKLVLFDFYADWCMPCRVIKPQIKDLASRFSDRLAVREIDVINWDSPVARQYGIGSLPHLKLFGPEGSLLAEGDVRHVMTVLDRRLTGVGGGPLDVSRSSPSPVTWVVLIGLVIVAVVSFRRLAAAGRPQTRSGDMGHRTPTAEAATGHGSPEIWFAVVGASLDGPFSVEQLAELRRKKLIEDASRVRRRGDATWKTAADVLEAFE